MADAGRPSLDLRLGGSLFVGPTLTQVEDAAPARASGVAPGAQGGLGVAVPSGAGEVTVHATIVQAATRNVLAGTAPLTLVGATLGWRLAVREEER